MSFHLKINDKISGPFDATQVEQILKFKIPNSFYSEDGGATWQKADDFGKGAEHLIDPTDDQLEKAGTGEPIPPVKPGQLRRCPLFNDMSDDQISHFTEALRQFRIKPYYPIIRAGSRSHSLFILVYGEARISIRTEGKEELLKVVETGDFFGEIALFDGGERSADVIANSECIALRITRDDVYKIMAANPAVVTPFLFNLGKILAQRLRDTNSRFVKAKNFAQTILS